jgi:hypothetical protein
MPCALIDRSIDPSSSSSRRTFLVAQFHSISKTLQNLSAGATQYTSRQVLTSATNDRDRVFDVIFEISEATTYNVKNNQK